MDVPILKIFFNGEVFFLLTSPLMGAPLDLELHEWDRQTSFPKKKTLMELGLGYVTDDLEKVGKLR